MTEERCPEHRTRLLDQTYCPACEHNLNVVHGEDLHWADADSKYRDQIQPETYDSLVPLAQDILEDVWIETHDWPETSPKGYGHPGERLNTLHLDFGDRVVQIFTDSEAEEQLQKL